MYHPAMSDSWEAFAPQVFNALGCFGTAAQHPDLLTLRNCLLILTLPQHLLCVCQLAAAQSCADLSSFVASCQTVQVCQGRLCTTAQTHISCTPKTQRLQAVLWHSLRVDLSLYPPLNLDALLVTLQAGMHGTVSVRTGRHWDSRSGTCRQLHTHVLCRDNVSQWAA